MRAKKATFVTSAALPAQFPTPADPEIAFAGRSNVGKSSLINSLIGAKIAKTSSTPGHTRLLNWFRVVPPSGPELAFVDLPGYGYAKVPHEMRAAWRPLVDAFVTSRDSLRLVVVIIDARRGPEAEERELVEWLAHVGRPTLVVLTKVDKLPKSKRLPAIQAARRALGLDRDPLLFSSLTGEGAAPLWRAIVAAAR
ncbi:MAG: YihA family ribosome biogenesis GTP-binding protein [Deltaproteobacteria bacterium]|nr:YihA family ribosome biogenesis GTP-binding protein [Deltaproteobacteria bacterium]